MRMIPSDEHVASTSPCEFGPNLTSVTDVRESTKFVLRTHFFTGADGDGDFSPITSSHTDAVRSKLHAAKT